MNETDEVMARINLGIEAETFLTSALGRYMVKRAESERDAALNEFRSIDPTDVAAVRDLQNRIWRAESVQSWIAEAIQDGWNSELVLKAQEATD